MPDVRVQQEGSPLPLWPEKGSELTDSRDPRLWDRVCTLLKDALQSSGLPFHILLLFTEREVVLNGRDRPALEALMKRARSRSWGVPLLPVLRNLPFLDVVDETAIPELTEWMRVLLTGRVSDVIQISETPDTSPEDQGEFLRNRITAIKERLTALAEGSGHRPWRCALAADRVELAKRLGSLAITTPREDSRSDLLIVIDTSDPNEQIGAIERYLPDGRRGDRTVRIVTYMRSQKKTNLERYCAENGLAPPMLIGGDFELWYLLLRLNEHATDDHNSIQDVALAKDAVMRIYSPSVLLTCTFDVHEADQWLAAAEEVGELLRLAPRDLTFRVELSADPDRLYVVLDDLQDVAAWIHIGHGRGRTGLWVPGRGLVPPERWSPCFRGRELRLALFMTCDSDEIARHFAEQGTRVAIGFNGDVDSEKARHLSVQVLRAMIADGMRGESILAGFRNGKSRFQALQDLNADPRAFYPRRR